jgi:Spy/CpxP family protein refolding chaperone
VASNDLPTETGTLPAATRRLAPGLVAAVVMFVILVAGFFAGVAVDRAYRRHVMRFGPRGGPSFVPGAPMPPMGEGPGPRGPRPRVLDRFVRELDLTPVQASALDSIMAQDFAAVRALREGMQPKIDSAVARTRQRIDSVLTPAQRDRYHEMLAREQGRGGWRGRGPEGHDGSDEHDGPGGPPPGGP